MHRPFEGLGVAEVSVRGRRCIAASTSQSCLVMVSVARTCHVYLLRRVLRPWRAARAWGVTGSRLATL